MILFQLLFGAMSVYMGLRPTILKGIAASRERAGMSPNLRSMRWSALLGGGFFVVFSLAQICQLLAE